MRWILTGDGNSWGIVVNVADTVTHRHPLDVRPAARARLDLYDCPVSLARLSLDDPAFVFCFHLITSDIGAELRPYPGTALSRRNTSNFRIKLLVWSSSLPSFLALKLSSSFLSVSLFMEYDVVLGHLRCGYFCSSYRHLVFCLLLNKVQFGRDSAQLSIATLSLSRATLCEILAIRVLRMSQSALLITIAHPFDYVIPSPALFPQENKLIQALSTTGGWSERSLPLATVLLTPWALFQGASEAVVQCAKEDWDDELLTQGGNALEVC